MAGFIETARCGTVTGRNIVAVQPVTGSKTQQSVLNRLLYLIFSL